MRTEKLFEMADSFVDYFEKHSKIRISKDFLREYYIFSNSVFISVVEFIKWLNIRRDTMVTKITDKYTEFDDYYLTTMEDEKKHVKLYDLSELTFKPNQIFIKITSNCFKDICVLSSSEKGILVRLYYKKLDQMFQTFIL